MLVLIMSIFAFANGLEELWVKDTSGTFRKLDDREKAHALDPARFLPEACKKMVNGNKEFILEMVAEGQQVFCVIDDTTGPVIHYEHPGGGGFHGCGYDFSKPCRELTKKAKK